MSPGGVRVAVLDDHVVVRYGIELLVQHSVGYEWVGSAGTGAELSRLLASARCDVLVLDYQLGPDDIDGASQVRHLRAHFPRMRILVYSSYAGNHTANVMQRAGAHGLLAKSAGLDALLEAVRSVAAGQSVFDRGVPDGDIPVRAITARENEVLRCCLQGMTVTEMAAKFCRSVKTVSAQKQAGFRKLGVRNDHEFLLAYGGMRPETGWQRR
ncbi:response regulator [Xylophilus sp. Kf1]|nr:response regulator [Xylophilus sp. Kf1]